MAILMTKRKAKDLKVGDTISIASKKCTIQSIEISDIGKQGTRKVRLELVTPEGERVVVIRPEDYPFEIL